MMPFKKKAAGNEKGKLKHTIMVSIYVPPIIFEPSQTLKSSFGLKCVIVNSFSRSVCTTTASAAQIFREPYDSQ